MTEQPGSSHPPLRPHLSGMAVGALMARALENPAPGAPWPDGYERISLLGSGGKGEVHLARDHTLGREVAIKLVLPDLKGEPMILERLQREARAMSKLNHSGIDQDPSTPIGQAATASFSIPPGASQVFLRLQVAQP